MRWESHGGDDEIEIIFSVAFWVWPRSKEKRKRNVCVMMAEEREWERMVLTSFLSLSPMDEDAMRCCLLLLVHNFTRSPFMEKLLNSRESIFENLECSCFSFQKLRNSGLVLINQSNGETKSELILKSILFVESMTVYIWTPSSSGSFTSFDKKSLHRNSCKSLCYKDFLWFRKYQWH